MWRTLPASQVYGLDASRHVRFVVQMKSRKASQSQSAPPVNSTCPTHRHRHRTCMDIEHKQDAVPPSYGTFGQMLNILAVCRQIHREAALIPYELSTFSFCRLTDLKPFTIALAQEQRHTVHSVYLSILRECAEITTAHMTEHSIRALKGVRNLAIFYELSVHGPRRMTFFDVRDPAQQDAEFEKIFAFGDAALESVNVVIGSEHSWYRTFTGVVHFSLEDLKAWALRMENKLVQHKPQDGERGNKGDAKRCGCEAKKQER